MPMLNLHILLLLNFKRKNLVIAVVPNQNRAPLYFFWLQVAQPVRPVVTVSANMHQLLTPSCRGRQKQTRSKWTPPHHRPPTHSSLPSLSHATTSVKQPRPKVEIYDASPWVLAEDRRRTIRKQLRLRSRRIFVGARPS